LRGNVAGARDGIDPIEARKAAKAQLALDEGKAVIFREAAERYIAAHENSWRNPKHRAQWPATLKAYAYPTMSALPVSAIDVGHVLERSGGRNQKPPVGCAAELKRFSIGQERANCDRVKIRLAGAGTSTTSFPKNRNCEGQASRGPALRENRCIQN
jgi:hypothetical protein